MGTILPRPGGLVARLRGMAAWAEFAFLKLPLILMLILVGFAFEAIVQLPFRLRLGGHGARRVAGRRNGA